MALRPMARPGVSKKLTVPDQAILVSTMNMEYHLMYDTADAIVYKTFRVIRQTRGGWLVVALVKSEQHYDEDIPDEVIEYPVEEAPVYRARKTKRTPERDGKFDYIKIYINPSFCYASRWLGTSNE